MRRKILREQGEETSKEIEVSSDSPMNSLDNLITREIMNAERAAVKAGMANRNFSAMEAVEKRNLNFIFEADDLERPPLDMGTFTLEMSRLISNAASLIDLKTAILNMTFSYLMSKYDKEIAEEFLQTMEDDFQMAPEEEHEDSDRQHSSSDDDSEIVPQHYAPGARGGGTTA